MGRFAARFLLRKPYPSSQNQKSAFAKSMSIVAIFARIADSQLAGVDCTGEHRVVKSNCCTNQLIDPPSALLVRVAAKVFVTD
jgi:hypothetical protein